MPADAPMLAQRLRRFHVLGPRELTALLGDLRATSIARNHDVFLDMSAAQLAEQAAIQLEQAPPGALAGPLLETLTYRIWLALYRAGMIYDSPAGSPAPTASFGGQVAEPLQRFPAVLILPLLFLLPLAWAFSQGFEPQVRVIHERDGMFGHHSSEVLSWSAAPWEHVLPALLLLLGSAGLVAWSIHKRQTSPGVRSAGPAGALPQALPAAPPLPRAAVEIRDALEQQVELAERSGNARWSYDAQLALYDLLPRTVHLHEQRGASDDDPAFLTALTDVLTVARSEATGTAQRSWDEHVAFLRDRVRAPHRDDHLSAIGSGETTEQRDHDEARS